MSNTKILFGALLFSESAMLDRKGSGITPAARRWIFGFTGGMRTNGKQIFFLGHEITSFYPKGSLLPGENKDLIFQGNSFIVKYLNVFLIRWLSLQISYKYSYSRSIKKWGDFEYFYSYNASSNQIALGNYIKKNYDKTKWVLIILDYDADTKNLKSFKNKTKAVDYFVFLSNWAFLNFPVKNKFLLEGGVNEIDVDLRYEEQRRLLNNNSKTEAKIILYSGMFSRWGGLNLLLDAFKKIEGNYELWICGFGVNSYLDSMTKKDIRIKNFGVVSEAELEKISLMTSVFVNPRPLNIQGNNMNFPSKLLEYLSYCKPVISTKTLGIPEEYYKICIMVDDDPDSIKTGILSAINKSNESLEKLAQRTKKFLKIKSWNSQLKSLNLWLNNIEK